MLHGEVSIIVMWNNDCDGQVAYEFDGGKGAAWRALASSKDLHLGPHPRPIRDLKSLVGE